MTNIVYATYDVVMVLTQSGERKELYVGDLERLVEQGRVVDGCVPDDVPEIGEPAGRDSLGLIEN